MIKKLPYILTGFALLATPVPSYALDIPARSSADSRIRYVNYNQWDVVRVVGTSRTALQIIFSQEEEIVDVGLGDTVGWEDVPRGNILYLKVRHLHPPTNMQVATQRADGTTRTYSFELISRDGEILNNNKDVYFQVRYKYPKDAAEARQAARAAAKAKAQEHAARTRLSQSIAHSGEKNWRYLAAGSKLLQPLSVYDNGEHTVLKFNRRSRLPSIYLVDERGKERIAQTTVRKNEIIIHGVAPEIKLRLDKDVTALYNEGQDLQPDDTGTSTTSHIVKRTIKGQN